MNELDHIKEQELLERLRCQTRAEVKAELNCEAKKRREKCAVEKARDDAKTCAFE
jgi:hypothetical protein